MPTLFSSLVIKLKQNKTKWKKSQQKWGKLNVSIHQYNSNNTIRTIVILQKDNKILNLNLNCF